MNLKANSTPSCITLYLPINTCRGAGSAKTPTEGGPQSAAKVFFKKLGEKEGR